MLATKFLNKIINPCNKMYSINLESTALLQTFQIDIHKCVKQLWITKRKDKLDFQTLLGPSLAYTICEQFM